MMRSCAVLLDCVLAEGITLPVDTPRDYLPSPLGDLDELAKPAARQLSFTPNQYGLHILTTHMVTSHKLSTLYRQM